MGQYLDEISRYALLTRVEEVALATEIQKWVQAEKKAKEKGSSLSAKTLEAGQAAQDKLVKANLRLVVSVARPLTRGGHFDLHELVSLGNEGLIVASRKYIPDFGVPFANYAAWWIKQRILKYTTERGSQSQLRIPAHRGGGLNQMLRSRAKLTQSLGRDPTNDEISRDTQVPVHEVNELLRLLVPAVELDAPAAADSDSSSVGSYLGETPLEADTRIEAGLHQIDLERAIAAALESLDERTRNVIIWSFGLNGAPPMDLDFIGQRLGVTRERARQLREGGYQILQNREDLRDLIRESVSSG